MSDTVREKWRIRLTVTLQLSPEQEAVLQSQAQCRGVSIQELLQEVAEQIAPSSTIALLQMENPAEWARQFHEWAESHDRTTPLLSDEAISRERIYRGCD
jgi:hypothetical protein